MNVAASSYEYLPIFGDTSKTTFSLRYFKDTLSSLMCDQIEFEYVLEFNIWRRFPSYDQAFVGIVRL